MVTTRKTSAFNQVGPACRAGTLVFEKAVRRGCRAGAASSVSTDAASVEKQRDGRTRFFILSFCKFNYWQSNTSCLEVLVRKIGHLKFEI